jgi:hypothetical protein
MKRMHIVRFKEELQTPGRGYVYDDKMVIYDFATMELPWKHNESNISCIPDGKYPVKKYNSDTYGLVFAVNDVPDRDLIRIHAANYSRELRGCIAPGKGFSDIDGDGLIDVYSSKMTLNELLDMMPEEFELTINWL